MCQLRLPYYFLLFLLIITVCFTNNYPQSIYILYRWKNMIPNTKSGSFTFMCFSLKEKANDFFFSWEDAKRAYHKFINDEKIMRHIQRNSCTLRYTYSYTLIYTLHIEYTQNNRLLHKIIDTKE